MVNVHMKLPKVVQSMLQDKNVLYIVAFLAVINFFAYILLVNFLFHIFNVLKIFCGCLELSKMGK